MGIFPPPPLIRISQKDIAGISASDGITVLTPAINQYENCLRCHGTSAGKQVLPIYGYFPVRAVSAGDPLNLIPQFAVDRHFQPSGHASAQQRAAAAQPAALHAESGRRHPGRAPWARRFSAPIATTATTIASSGARARTAPTAPGGLTSSSAATSSARPPLPGQLITNLFPNPDLSVAGPYAMCGKCHDLANQIMQEHQLEPAQQPHQRRLHLLHLPHRSRHGRRQRNHHRRAADQF